MKPGDYVTPNNGKTWYGEIIRVNPKTVVVKVKHPVGGFATCRKDRLRRITV